MTSYIAGQFKESLAQAFDSLKDDVVQEMPLSPHDFAALKELAEYLDCCSDSLKTFTESYG